MKRAAIGGVLLILATACGGSQGGVGPAGSMGAAGPIGATGAAGPAGADDNIVHGLHCSKVDSGTGTTLEYEYDSSTLSSGDRYVSCYVSTATQESSYSMHYSVAQLGATNGGCVVNLGVGASDFGFWEFTAQSGTNRVIYTDAGSAKNGYTYVFAAGDCSSF